MRRRHLLRLTGGSLVALGLVACAPEKRRVEPGVLTLTEAEQTAAFIRNFNPLLEVGDVRWATKNAIYEPLLIFNAMTGEWVPWLAEAHRWSEDRRALTVTVRDGVKWSDGTDFSAGDVVFTFELLKTFPALDLRGIWTYLDRIERSGRDVTFHFSRVFVPGLERIGLQPIVAEHVWSQVADPVTFSNENPVGTGPFTEVTQFQTQVYRVDRNPHYWRGVPKVKALRLPAFAANDQANLALVSGELDWAGYFVPVIDRTYVRRNPEHHHYWFPPLDGTVFIFPNHRVAPFEDVRVRKALSMAIDRELLVDVAMHGYTHPADATGLSDAFARFRSKEIAASDPWTRHDVAAARALLDEAGLRLDEDGQRLGPDGEVWELKIHVPSGFSDWVRAAQVAARGWKALGIDASIKTYDFGAWFDHIQKGEYEVSMGWSEVGATPYGFFRGMMSRETLRPVGEMAADNWHRFSIAQADEALTEIERTTDPAQEHALYGRLQSLFVEHAPAIPLFPGPLWGEFNTERFTGFPTPDDPYAVLCPNATPQPLLVLSRLEPVGAAR